MSEIHKLVDDIIDATSADPPDLDRLEALLQKVGDMKGTPLFREASLEDQGVLRDAERELKAKIRRSGTGGASQSGAEGGGSTTASQGGLDDDDDDISHNPQAAEKMDAAETAFYAGRYQEAINLYEQVLRIEPNWVRARENMDKAREYLQTGRIPASSLPAEAGIQFGKANSAFKVMNYARAKDLYDEVKGILKEAGIERFKEGQEFEAALNDALEAKEAYRGGLQSIQEGRWDEGLNQITMAAELVGIPLYKEKALEVREDHEKTIQIRRKLNSVPLTAEVVLETIGELDDLEAKYPGNNSTIASLKAQQRTALTKIMGLLRGNVRDELARGEDASSMKEAERSLDEVREKVN